MTTCSILALAACLEAGLGVVRPASLPETPPPVVFPWNPQPNDNWNQPSNYSLIYTYEVPDVRFQIVSAKSATEIVVSEDGDVTCGKPLTVDEASAAAENAGGYHGLYLALWRAYCPVKPSSSFERSK